MENLDVKNKETKTSIVNAINSGNAEELADKILEANIQASQEIQNRLIQESKTFNAENADMQVLASRGFRALTHEETKYYNAVADASSLADVPLPRTVFDRVFEDLLNEHPLLSEITFQNTTGITEFVTRTGEVAAAWWGPLCDEIKKKLENGFKVEAVNLYKVSAYMPICKAMLDLGPVWLDRFVRESLGESIAMALEEAILVGDGENKPIGMTRKLTDVSASKHVEKTPVALTDLAPATIGTQIMTPLTKGRITTLGKILLIVNPNDYWSKLFPVTTYQTEEGQYKTQNLPFNAEIIQSVHVPANRMIVGQGKDYFMGVGSAKKIEYSDEFRFLDDQRVYIAKQYANGRPVSDEAFLYFDITDLKLLPAAEVTPTP